LAQENGETMRTIGDELQRERTLVGAAVCAAPRDEARASPDLVILNKFGKAEAEEGGGLRGAIVAALEADIPVLIGVAGPYAPALREFAGDLCALAADAAAVWHWLRARLGERARFGERERIAPWPNRSRDNRGDAPWRTTGYSASPRSMRPCRS
jgi:hypothetical protein